MVDKETLLEQDFQVPDTEEDEEGVSMLEDGFVARTKHMESANAVFPIDIQMKNVTLEPAVQTNYRCRSLSIPFDMNVAAFEAVWKDGQSTTSGGDNLLMHHMGLYRCEDPSFVPSQHRGRGRAWHCMDEMPACEIVLESARGTGMVQVPAGVHMDLTQYALLIHQEKPIGLTVTGDTSGYRLWVETPSTPSTTAPAQIAVHEEKHSTIQIPANPDQKEISLHFLISAEATRDRVPGSGVQVFGGDIHMHERGVRGRVELLRDGVHIMDVYNSMSYDFDRSEAMETALIVTCVYTCTGRCQMFQSSEDIAPKMKCACMLQGCTKEPPRAPWCERDNPSRIDELGIRTE